VIAARYLCLLLPAALALAGVRLERDRRARGAALLAFVAAATGIAALHEVANVAGWYAFAPVDGAFRGLPVDLWWGWAALWGAVPVLYRRALPLPVTLGLLAWLDVATMPALHPLVQLQPAWLVGEAVGLLVVVLPAQLLGRWTADERHLAARVVLQLVVFSATVLWLVPTAAFELGDGGWDHLTGLPAPWPPILVQVGLLLAAPGLLAVREFAVRGGGTPYPWDPPRRLVSTGPYAYVANPMQLSAVTLLALLASAAHSRTLAAGTAAAVAFSAGVARIHERHDLAGRFGRPWYAYRRQVRDWWPRWRPYLPGPAARLWLDGGCGPCLAIGGFLRERGARRLAVVPAHRHQQPLWRSQYAGGDGHRERGVAAVARALEHVNLAWAWLGWLLRLPGVGWLTQLVTDAMIAPPHEARPARSAPGG
jgi:protein-S-isoprenylcysteine O-methyltransferase Ste14